MSPAPRRPRAGDVGGGSRVGAASERMMLMRAFGEKLRQLRLEAGLTPGRLARRCRVVRDTLSKAEGGRIEPSRGLILILILILCDRLGVCPDTLLGGLPVPQERGSR